MAELPNGSLQVLLKLQKKISQKQCIESTSTLNPFVLEAVVLDGHGKKGHVVSGALKVGSQSLYIDQLHLLQSLQSLMWGSNLDLILCWIMLDPPPEAFLPDLIEEQLAQLANACSGDIGSALCEAFRATDSVLRQNRVGQVARASGDTRIEEFGK